MSASPEVLAALRELRADQAKLCATFDRLMARLDDLEAERGVGARNAFVLGRDAGRQA